MASPAPGAPMDGAPVPAASSLIDYLVVGHVTKDLLSDDGFTFGGTATFSALTARNLGRRTALLSRTAALPGLTEYLSGIALHLLPADQTTTFENVYTAAGRTQHIREVAPPIPTDSVPVEWRNAPVVHLGPVSQEVPHDLPGVFASTSLIGATPQGWLRAWDESGLVRPTPWEDAEQLLDRIDVLIFSPEDVGDDPALVRRYAEMARLAVVTNDRTGCVIWTAGRRERFPAFDVKEVDATGAGDVFATAFLLRYGDTRDHANAARYANCAASFVVEGRGPSIIPTAEQVEERLRTGKARPLAD